MKILVVDDEHSFGSLLGRALKKLGHKAELASHPEDALARFLEQEFDAVITDIDMPVMTGVELAERIRAHRAEIPIAFCTGSAPDDTEIARAERIGRVLPKVWTVADVKQVVSDLEAARRRLARGSSPRVAEGLAGTTAASEPLTVATPVGHVNRRPPRKIKVTCRDWRQVNKLCDEQSAGKTHLSLRGAYALEVGDRILVALSLPDELVLSISAEVRAVETDVTDGRQIFRIAMVGLTPEICARLRSMAGAAGAAPGKTYQRVRTARASTGPRAESPSQLLGNFALRKQIDELGKKLKN